MQNPVNTAIDAVVITDIEVSRPPIETDTVPGIELPAPKSAKQPRNQHLRVAEPKDKAFAARCTQSEFDTITKAMQANGCTDIVRLMLLSIDLHKKDFLTPFKF